MRTIFYLLLLVSFAGCKKDDSTELPLTGVWLFKESRYGNPGPQVIKADPVRPVKIEFKMNGTFSINAEPLFSSIQAQFMFYNRYQLLPDNKVRFYNTDNTEEVTFNFELGQELEIYHPNCREGCSDYFVRSY